MGSSYQSAAATNAKRMAHWNLLNRRQPSTWVFTGSSFCLSPALFRPTACSRKK